MNKDYQQYKSLNIEWQPFIFSLLKAKGYNHEDNNDGSISYYIPDKPQSYIKFSTSNVISVELLQDIIDRELVDNIQIIDGNI